MVTEETTTEIATKEAPKAAAGSAMAIIPKTLDEIKSVAELLMKSKLAPKGVTLEGLQIRIMHGLEVGLRPMQSIQVICDINGHSSIYGDGALGLVQGSNLLQGSKEWYTGKEGTDEWTAHCMVQRVGTEPHTVPYSVKDAKRAKLWTKQGPWQTDPRRMLMWRARGFAYRDRFADVLRGLRFVEETRDIPKKIHWQEAAEVEEAATSEGTRDLMRDAMKPAKDVVGEGDAEGENGETAEGGTEGISASDAVDGEITESFVDDGESPID